MTKISDIGEKQLIASLIRPLFTRLKKGVEVNIGDDAAVLQLTDSLSLVLTIDKIPEQLVAHSLGIMDLCDVGRYLVVANLSDLAAMGAGPIALLLSLCLPQEFETENLEMLTRGIAETAAHYGVPVVGGDTGGGSAISLVAAAVGTIMPGKALTRGGAKPDDVIFSTGYPGAFGTALAYLLAAKPAGLKYSDDQEKGLFKKFLQPEPRLKEGKKLSELGLVNACQDISDGVGQTLIEISDMSGLGFSVRSDLLLEAAPSSIFEIAAFSNCSPEAIMLGPGADFELLFSVPPDKKEELIKIFKEENWRLHRLGKFIEKGHEIVSADGTKKQIPQLGWQHFTGRTDIENIRSKYTSDTE